MSLQQVSFLFEKKNMDLNSVQEFKIKLSLRRFMFLHWGLPFSLVLPLLPLDPVGLVSVVADHGLVS